MWDRRRTAKFQRLLLAWYGRHRRDLPWRGRPDPYRIWISEVMLQQTQVRTVVPYFERFVARFPEVASLASAREDEVLALWAGLGYYRRARNLHRAAQAIVAERGGRFPETLDDIAGLPGIGRYTAGAIASIAFGLPEPIVDGNVRRVLSRLRALEGTPPESFFWEAARAWIPRGRASEFNQAVMELGALVCVPAQPLCRSCPVEALCEARRMGLEARIPSPRRRRSTEDVRLVMLVLEHEGRVLFVRERQARYIPGAWGLPTDALAAADGAEAAARSLARRLARGRVRLEHRGVVRHGVTYRRIEIEVFRGALAERPVTDGAARWITRRRLGRWVISSAFRKAIRASGLL